MKTMQEIQEELLKELPLDVNIHEEHEGWNHYASISGYLDGLWFDIYLLDHPQGERHIEIASTTKNPKRIVSIIRDISDDIKIIR